jgi:capsular exopolysaccharide synthesis family protein
MIEDLRSSVAGVKQKLDAVNQQITDVRKEMADASNQMSAYLTLMDEQKAYRELLKQVDDQLDAVRNNDDHPVASVGWMNTPDLPDTMSFPRLPITLSLAIVLGLAFSLGIAFLREMLDTSVRSPRDIARVGQLNLLGMISDEAEDPQSAGARLPLIIAEAPHSMLAEQFRQMRTRLQHAASLDTTRSILVTSPGPGDGKTTAAGNLAAGLALNGRRILLVDANFRRPELHKLFGIGNEQGFSDVLNSVNQFDALVQQTHVPNLAVLTSGAKPANPTELLESQLFIDFIERALEEYDHVIFDSGPLLFTSDTVAMAPRVDGVVSVVRARTNSRGLLQRMRDTLRQVKAEHLGVLLNAVRAQAGGYYNRNIKTYYDYQNRG